jgi:hypothetical protein
VKVLENEVQIAALSLFALMYAVRLLWLRSLRQPMEKMEADARALWLSLGTAWQVTQIMQENKASASFNEAIALL